MAFQMTIAGGMKSDRERAREICELTSHKWRDVYYGIECEQCGLFYPDGCEPWLPMNDDEDEDE